MSFVQIAIQVLEQELLTPTSLIQKSSLKKEF
jgi:hypothetical protein